jgi:hypothetical protein
VTRGNPVVLRESPLESARFGLRVFRCDVETIDASAISEAIDRLGVDVLILRVPAREIGGVNALARLGLSPILADTLVYYDTVLARHAETPATTGVALRPASRDDAALLARTARDVFDGYVSHYHANPLFAPERILEGYAEWASRHAAAEDDASGAWLVERDGKLAGFSCYRFDQANGIATGVLNGILPPARARGTYRAMLGAMLRAFAEAGFSRFEISTQVHNIGVQRVWTAHGLTLREASNTVHINALRTAGARSSAATPSDRR